jgi:3',5'-cyclic AMP phosphodiesterase CpdA
VANQHAFPDARKGGVNMSLILHLSDLHLGSPSPIQYNYTDKFGLAASAGDTGTDHLERTLSALGAKLAELSRQLDAVVVSGDLTNANKPDGYDAFGKLLALLGEALPPQARIVVTPGNHDADWKRQPGDTRKFKRFLSAVRGDYCSPLMLGIDYETGSVKAPRAGYHKAKPILELPDAVVVAISSADYCGVEEGRTKTDWPAVLTSYLADERTTGADAEREAAKKMWKQAEEDLRRLRVADMARVDPDQLVELDKLLKRAMPATAEEDERVRIAVLHHPIGPVSEEEEVKPFDSLTNLAAVRSFLLQRGFHIVLHGHKHNSYVGWDWLAEPGDETTQQWRTFVVCSPGVFRRGKTVCRLIDTRPGDDKVVLGAPRFSLISVNGVGPGQGASLDSETPAISLAQPFVRSENPAAPWVVRARTADAAYQQLRDLQVHEQPRQVISIVESPESTAELPSNYPGDWDEKWLSNLVKWWQHPRPEAVRAYLGSQYNHGERLYGGPDAITIAAKALPSSKAIALLITPQEAADPTREYPALTVIQLQARTDGTGTRIDVLGIFRKQDLERWWPVNMAELRHIQLKALGIASTTELPKPVTGGRLIAMTSNGVKENVLPQIAGTALDRAIDLDPGYMQRLAYVARQPQAETVQEWRDALEDIGEVSDGLVLVPSIGIERLSEAVEIVRTLGQPSARLTTLCKRVQRLAERAFAARDALGSQSPASPPSSQSRTYWSKALREDADAVMSSIRACANAGHA